MGRRGIDQSISLGTKKTTDRIGLGWTRPDHTDRLPMTSSFAVGRRGSCTWSTVLYISSYKDTATVMLHRNKPKGSLKLGAKAQDGF